MKLLQSSWGAAIVGLVAYLLTTYVCWTKATASLLPAAAEAAHADAVESPPGPSWTFRTRRSRN